ncbi:DUF4234 domain-containing protein [Marinobacterium marinum]|uniref:DUF4234 domain-containing protein n=1 Tax=Marinobacterium marinum TaxID=2756129 RepID=A0A7W2ADM1_9GAMM|nr:DUF4234 domain-containing protein [Marinobacterium marinum]MBA4503353.1 DUF4234 domain-containing protein [Marinobacterium marinum]
MNQIADNPYAAPEAELEVPKAAGDLSVFKRFTTWGVFALLIVTFGIYGIYWLYTRTNRLNQISDDPISAGFMNITTGCYIGSVIFPFLLMPLPYELMSVLSLLSPVLSLAGMILMVVWVFKFRNRLNRVTQSKGKPTWCGPILTFFFNVLYLNYKVNQNIDMRG